MCIAAALLAGATASCGARANDPPAPGARPRAAAQSQAPRKAETVPELLLDEGYHTFWTGHNCSGFFTGLTKGMEQGFTSKKVVHSRNPKMDDLMKWK